MKFARLFCLASLVACLLAVPAPAGPPGPPIPGGVELACVGFCGDGWFSASGAVRFVAPPGSAWATVHVTAVNAGSGEVVTISTPSFPIFAPLDYVEWFDVSDEVPSTSGMWTVTAKVVCWQGGYYVDTSNAVFVRPAPPPGSGGD